MRGAVGVEFAIGGMMMLMIVFVIFDIGLIFLDQCGLDYGASVAARWGAVNSASASVSTVLAQFQTAARAVIGNASSACGGYASAAAVPTGKSCYIVVTFPNGATVGSLITVQAYYTWSPVAVLDGFKATTLQSTVSFTIEN